MSAKGQSTIYVVEFDRSREHWRNADNQSYSEAGITQLRKVVETVREAWLAKRGDFNRDMVRLRLVLDLPAAGEALVVSEVLDLVEEKA